MATSEDHWRQASYLLDRMQRRDELESLLESLIPILDSFDRLDSYMSNGKQVDDPAVLMATYNRIGEQLRSAVADIGLMSYGVPGDSVELGRYRVIDVRLSADQPADTVVDVVRPGYQKDGRVFRSAEVIVAEPTKESQA